MRSRSTSTAGSPSATEKKINRKGLASPTILPLAAHGGVGCSAPNLWSGVSFSWLDPSAAGDRRDCGAGATVNVALNNGGDQA